MRRGLAGGLALSVVATALAVLGVRPATAAPVAYDEVATTAVVAGASLQGNVGAAGGLATLDGGSAKVVATLDSGPASHVIAAPYEPGGLVRTIVGQVNTQAGQQVLEVPDAEGSSPGTTPKDSVETVPATTVGPLSLAGGAATAAAAAHHAAGSATGSWLHVDGVLTLEGSTSSVELTADAATGRVTESARGAVGAVDVAGVLQLSDVVGTATTSAHGDAHTARQSLAIGGASVNGQAVTIGNDGVTAAGTTLVPGQTLADATAQANAALAAAGITVRTVGGTVVHDSRSADADTGGVQITVTTPGLPVGGVAGNTLTVRLGQVALTEHDSLPTPFGLSSGVALPTGPNPGRPPTSTTTFVPGATTAGPSVAGGPLAAPVTSPVSYLVVGHRVSAPTALLAFAVWQLLTLGLPTLYALVERRRRLQGAR